MKRLRSLSSRILIGATAAVALALLLAGTYFSIAEREALDRVFDKQNQTLTDALAVFSIEQLVSLDYPALEHALQIAGNKNDNIKSIEVVRDGQTVVRFGAPEIRGRVFVSDVITREGDPRSIGQIRIIFSTKDNDVLKAARLHEHIATMVLLFAVMGFSLRWLLRRTVIKPIQVLTERTEQTIAEALPELPLIQSTEDHCADEIQQLDQRFRRLLDGLKTRDEARTQAEQTLVEHQNNLEQLIDERTRALQIAQEEANRLNKVKSEFLAAASHDLRQPIQALNLFHSTLARSPLNEEQQRLNSLIGVSLASLSEILNTLLDISKIDAGIVQANPKPIRTEDLFARIEAEFAPMAQARQLRFKFFFPFREITLFTDAELLFSLLRNLIDNAIKYTEQGGILVSLRQRGQYALLQVWDTGIGISAEHKQEIFEEYVQLANPERDNRKGLGLGLSIVSRLARLLGSRVTCHSQPGRGTVFEFSIALAEATPADRPASRTNMDTAIRRRTFAGRKVIVVEDDLMTSQAIALSLGGLGMQVHMFSSADEALDNPLIADTHFYISDYRLPGKLHGLDFLNTIQQRAQHPIRAVLMTGGASPKQADLLRNSPWPVLLKPVELEQLLSAMENVAAPPNS